MLQAWKMSAHWLLATLVAATATVFVACSSKGGPAEPMGTPTAPIAAATDVSGLPRLPSGQTVCQGLLRVPRPGEPRTFPAEYTQRQEANGITIVANGKVSAEALRVATATIRTVTAKPEVRDPLVAAGAYVIVAARGQGILELPEFACLGRDAVGGQVAHACGIADRADYPVVTVNEADLLGEKAGPCLGSNILFHELGHLVQTWTLSPPDYFDIRQFYEDAKRSGKYGQAYAMINPNEYWAEATQAYFDRVAPAAQDRRWLEENDPQIFAIALRVYGP